MQRKTNKPGKRALVLLAAALAVPLFAGNAFADNDNRGRRDNDNNRRQSDRNDRNDRNDRRDKDRHDNDRRWSGRNDRHDDNNKGSIFFSFGAPVTRVIVSDPCEATNHASGYYRQEWCPPVYETRYDACGRPYTVLASAGHYNQVWVSTSPPVVHTYRTNSIVIGGRIRF